MTYPVPLSSYCTGDVFLIRFPPQFFICDLVRPPYHEDVRQHRHLFIKTCSLLWNDFVVFQVSETHGSTDFSANIQHKMMSVCLDM